MEEQRELRSRLLAERRLLTPPVVRQKSFVIEEKILSLKEFRKAGTVALYHPLWNEVLTDEIANGARKRGSRVVYPEVKGSEMFFATPSRREVVPPSEIDFFAVPGVVFDEKCFRIGLGKGFYDRTLSPCRGVKVGLAYDFQILEKIPHNPHDLVCDRVVSEKRSLAKGNSPEGNLPKE